MFVCTVACDIMNHNSFCLFPQIVLMQPMWGQGGYIALGVKYGTVGKPGEKFWQGC